METNENEEGFYLVPRKVLKDIADSNTRILTMLEQGNNNPAIGIGDYISEKDAMKMLSKKTTWFFNMRKSGKLTGHKIGGTNFYDRKEIIGLLDGI